MNSGGRLTPSRSPSPPSSSSSSSSSSTSWLTFFKILILLISIASATKSSCKHKFQTCYAPVGQLTSCYQLYPLLPRTWKEAKEFCEAKGANLLSQEDYEEWLWLKTELDEIALEEPPKGCKGEEVSLAVWWIGGHYEQKDNVWFWSGTKQKVPNKETHKEKETDKRTWKDWKGEWAPEEPRHYEGSECMSLKFGPAPYNWVSLHCQYRLPFICKWKQSHRNNVCTINGPDGTKKQMPKVEGSCGRSLQRYYFNLAVEECQPFTYNGCNGGPNMFQTKKACKATCDRAKEEKCSIKAEDGEFRLPDGSTTPIQRSPGESVTLDCPKGTRMFKRSDESLVPVTNLTVACLGAGLVWDHVLPICLPDCRDEEYFKGFGESFTIFNIFWKRLWHHRTDEGYFQRSKVFKSCYFFGDDKKLSFAAAKESCKDIGASLMIAEDPLELEMLSAVTADLFWRGRMRYVKEGKVTEFDTDRRPDYNAWWIQGLNTDVVANIKGTTIGPNEIYSAPISVLKDFGETHLYVCKKEPPALPKDIGDKLAARIKQIYDKIIQKKINRRDGDGGEGDGGEGDGGNDDDDDEARDVIDDADKLHKPIKGVDDDEETKEKLEELEKIVNKKKKTCCAILALALNAREALRMEKMDARVAKMTIDNAKQKADAMGCSKKLTCNQVAEANQKETNAIVKQKKRAPSVPLDCAVASHVAADAASGAPTCTNDQKKQAKVKVENDILEYLSNYRRPDNGKYSGDGSKMGRSYVEQKTKKFLKDKSLGGAVFLIATSANLVEELIKEGKIVKKDWENFEKYATLESYEEQRRIAELILAENRKETSYMRLDNLVEQYKDASLHDGALGQRNKNMLQKAAKKTASGKPKSVVDLEGYLTRCDIDDLKPKCIEFLKKEGQEEAIDVKEIEGVVDEFRRRNWIKAHLCSSKAAEKLKGKCEVSELSGLNVKNDLDVRLALNNILRFGLDMPKQRLKMLKKIIQSPHMKAAKDLGLDFNSDIDELEAKIEYQESNLEKELEEPDFDATNYSKEKCIEVYKEESAHIRTAIICLQGALVEKVGTAEEVKTWMTPDEHGWPPKLANMVDDIENKIIDAINNNTIDEKVKVLKEAIEKGYDGNLKDVLLIGSCKKEGLDAIQLQMDLSVNRYARVSTTNLIKMKQTMREKNKQRPMLNGESFSLSCREPGLYEPVNNTITCRSGTIEWNEDLSCNRKKCEKPSLQGGVSFVGFEERSLFTKNEEKDKDGKLEIKCDNVLDRSNFTDDVTSFQCMSDKSWMPEIPNGRISCYRPKCKDIDAKTTKPLHHSDKIQKQNPYANFIIDYDSQKNKAAGSKATPKCQRPSNKETITDPDSLYCDPDKGGVWKLNKTHSWDGTITCTFKGWCTLPNKETDTEIEIKCLAGSNKRKCRYEFGGGNRELKYGVTQVDPGTEINEIDCDVSEHEITSLSTTFHDDNLFRFDFQNFHVQHVCEKREGSNKDLEKGVWKAKFENSRIKNVTVPIPSLNNGKFFCKKICKTGFQPLLDLFLVNTGEHTGDDCCVTSKLTNYFGCWKSYGDKLFTYKEAEAECNEVNGILPLQTLEHIRMLCEGRGLNYWGNICNKMNDDGAGGYDGGYWLQSYSDIKHFVGRLPNTDPLCEVTTTSGLVHSAAPSDTQKLVCVHNFQPKTLNDFWTAVKEESKNCKDSCTIDTTDIKSAEKSLENSENCCLEYKQWPLTWCDKNKCENPLVGQKYDHGC